MPFELLVDFWRLLLAPWAESVTLAHAPLKQVKEEPPRSSLFGVFGGKEAKEEKGPPPLKRLDPSSPEFAHKWSVTSIISIIIYYDLF